MAGLRGDDAVVVSEPMEIMCFSGAAMVGVPLSATGFASIVFIAPSPDFTGGGGAASGLAPSPAGEDFKPPPPFAGVT
jgi:hypothetical protein